MPFVRANAELRHICAFLHSRQQVLSPVPEPESYALLLAGLGLMGTIALRRSAKIS